MKKLLFCCLIPLIFAFGAGKDYDKIQREDGLSNENLKHLKACEENNVIESCDKISKAYAEVGDGAFKREYKANMYKERVCDLLHKQVMSLNTIQEYVKWYQNVLKNNREKKWNPSGFECVISADYYKRSVGLEKARSPYHKACDLQFRCEEILSFYEDKDSKEYKKLWLKSKMVKGVGASFWVHEIPIFSSK